ncbi:ankyrin repeat domain containing protein [Pandoravirus japonicus]|uniref:Ankyrin repeat domain containing protein n=1 Tax=Pandoravirus japonicus TaxID=2823154 RepID=A0A811BM06_9VIRU|nr:ankyrin repeat domain containing protein [Pandoravirus japonicus]
MKTPASSRGIRRSTKDNRCKKHVDGDDRLDSGCGIASMPAAFLEAALDRLDDADFGACMAAHRCFRDAAHPHLWEARRDAAWLRRGPLWACATNNVGALAALVAHGAALQEAHLAEAARSGHLDAVAFLCQEKMGIVANDDANDGGDDDDDNDDDDTEHVVGNGHAQKGTGPTALDVAAANGHGAVVRFLHANLKGPRVATTAAMDQAAEHGHLDIVVFLHEHRTEGCTECAMDWAAANGHTAIVAYLHEHRREGCTPWAMNAAATNGHLRTVAYLHEHRGEGCTTDAMDGAAANGHEDVIVYLDRHRDEGCTASARIDACLGGHDHIVLLMEERGIVPGRRRGRRRRHKAAAP